MIGDWREPAPPGLSDPASVATVAELGLVAAVPPASLESDTAHPLFIWLLIVWTTLLLLTHLGARSPYTQVDASGTIAHGDARTVAPVTRFFYDGTEPQYALAHNLKLPLHSFTVAVVGSFVRSYLAANYLANALALALLVCCAMRLGARFGLAPGPLVLSLGTLLTLPPVVGYAGQPMHYTIGMVANALLVMAAAAMSRDRLRNPWTAGATVAFLAVAYDPYVFIAAFVLLFATVGFRRRRDDAVFVTVALLPPAMWHLYLAAISSGQVSSDIRERFIHAVIVEWAGFFEAPLTRILLPFIATHVGMQVALQQVVALIYWPVLLAGAAALWIARPSLRAHHASRLAVLLVAAYVLQQVLTAAFDWENNPRRALPAVIAFGFAYVRAADRLFFRRAWRYLLVLLFVTSAFLSLGDVVSQRNVVSHPYTGEAVRQGAKVALRDAAVRSSVVTAAELPLLGRLPRATVQAAPAFLFAQLFGAALLVGLFWILARAELLPRSAPLIAAVVIVASGVRFFL